MEKKTKKQLLDGMYNLIKNSSKSTTHQQHYEKEAIYTIDNKRYYIISNELHWIKDKCYRRNNVYYYFVSNQILFQINLRQEKKAESLYHFIFLTNFEKEFQRGQND